MIGYRALLDVPRELVVFVAQLVRVERRARGTRRGARALTCRQQAAFVLVWFRMQEDLGLLGTGFGISRATASRYRDEAGGVLAAQAPELTAALERVATEGWSHVVLDGTVVASDRCAAKTTSSKGEQIDLWYAGKTHGFGGNVQAVLRPDGLTVWVCGVLPGSVPDLTATRANVLAALSAARRTGLPTRADGGYDGAGQGMYTPVKQPPGGIPLAIKNRAYHTLLRSLRCRGERGFALLTRRWRVL